MNQTMRRVWTLAAILVAAPVLAYDRPDSGQDQTQGTQASQEASPRTSEGTDAKADDSRAGAPGMEPQEAETQQDRAEREFVEEIWTSP